MKGLIILLLVLLLAGCVSPASQSGGIYTRSVIDVRDSTGTHIVIRVWGDHRGDSGEAIASATSAYDGVLHFTPIP